jgi:hypothetical protein
MISVEPVREPPQCGAMKSLIFIIHNSYFITPILSTEHTEHTEWDGCEMVSCTT